MHGLIFNINFVPTNRNSGGHRIATILRKNSWDIEVFDFAFHVELDILKEFVRQRYSSETRFFGFSTFFSQWSKDLTDFTAWLKKEYPNIPTILGGQDVGTTSAKNIDYWIDSFGEHAIVALLRNLCNFSSEPIKFDNRFTDKKIIKSVRDYPAYPLDSYAIEYEERDYIEKYEWLTVEFSRGCKFKCDFCNFPILGVKGDYTRTQQDFEEEIKRNYDKWGIQHYYIADETFNDRPEKIRKFADVVDSKIDFSPYFSGFMRGDLLISHPESWDDLKTLGVYGQYYGVETFNQAAGKNIGKGMHPDKLKEGLIKYKQFMNERPFRASLSFIVGLPKESVDSIEQTMSWLKKNWSDQAVSSYYLEMGFGEDNRLHEMTNVSSMRLNPEKYGISRMNKADFLTKVLEKKAKGNAPGINIEDAFLWKHNEMDIVDALEINDRFTKVVNNGRIDNWNLHYLTFLEEKLIEQCNKFSITKQEMHDNTEFKTKTERFVENYVNKKLGYC